MMVELILMSDLTKLDGGKNMFGSQELLYIIVVHLIGMIIGIILWSK